MNFFQKLEAQIAGAYHSFITPSVASVIEGQIALVNLDPAHADKTGDAKHFLVAQLVAGIFGIGEAIAHSLVKIVFDRLAAKEPAIFKPITQQIEDAAQAAVAQRVSRVEVKLTSGPLASVVTPTPVEAPVIPAPVGES